MMIGLLVLLGLCLAPVGFSHNGFQPEKSTSLQELAKIYNVRYADGTLIRIASAVEDIFLAGCAARSRLGLIRAQEDGLPELMGLDGILGFAFTPQKASASLLLTLTTPTRPSWSINQSLVACTAGRPYCPQPAPGLRSTMQEARLRNRSFSFFGWRPSADSHGATPGFGTLQLGGYSESVLQAGLDFYPMLMQSGYGIAITSLKYQGRELLKFSTASRFNYLVSEFDTGSRCMQIPDGYFRQSLGQKTYSKNPFRQFVDYNLTFPKHQVSAAGLSPPGLVFDFGKGHSYEIPVDDIQSGRACVEGFKSDDIILIGAPFFRYFMVYHDLTNQIQPRVGIGRLKKNVGDLARNTSGGSAGNSLMSKEMEDGRYSVPVGIGTPPQILDLLFDTGSSLLAIVTDHSSIVSHSRPTEDRRIPRTQYAWVTGVAAVGLWLCACVAVVLLWIKRRQQRARADGSYSRIVDSDFSGPIL